MTDNTPPGSDTESPSTNDPGVYRNTDASEVFSDPDGCGVPMHPSDCAARAWPLRYDPRVGWVEGAPPAPMATGPATRKRVAKRRAASAAAKKARRRQRDA